MKIFEYQTPSSPIEPNDSGVSEDLSQLSPLDLAKKYPDKAVEIAIEKLSHNPGSSEGADFAMSIINERGWDYFIDQGLRFK